MWKNSRKRKYNNTQKTHLKKYKKKSKKKDTLGLYSLMLQIHSTKLQILRLFSNGDTAITNNWQKKNKTTTTTKHDYTNFTFIQKYEKRDLIHFKPNKQIST